MLPAVRACSTRIGFPVLVKQRLSNSCLQASRRSVMGTLNWCQLLNVHPLLLADSLFDTKIRVAVVDIVSPVDRP